MLDSGIIPKQSSRIEVETFGDGVLLYHQTIRKAVHLNNNAALIWALCDGKNSIANIQNILIDAYPDGKDSIPEDINFTLEILKQSKAVEF